MATRIDKKVSQNLDIANNYSALQNYLLRRSGRKLNDINYVGLLRNNALSDLDDPGEALTNVLEYITRIDDANEISIYGTYKPEDFEITRDFVQNEITSSFLTPLAGISIAGGVAGATVSTNPRIRVEDRIDQINSFTGKGTLNGLHAGPTAIFYRARPGIDQEFGRLKFTSFNENTGVISLAPESTGIEGGSGGDSPTGKTFVFKDAASRLNFQSQTSFNPDNIVLTIKGYINPATNQPVSLVGTGITIKGTVTSSYVDNGQTIYVRQFQTTDANSLAKLKELKGIIGPNFLSTYYKFSRQFSILNPPQWFLESPGVSSNSLPYSADDINPETTQSLLEFRQGAFKLYSEKEYFNSGAYIETRIPVVDRYVYDGNNIVKDSNMRFSDPPRVLRDNQNNWGVRWDGFLRIDNDGVDKKYIFEIETNTSIKVDIVNGGTNLAPTWSEVFNSFDKSKNAKFIQEGDRYVSKTSFNLDNLPSRFIYKTNSTGTTGYRYVPISIRMWNGASDLAYSELEVPQEPNVFIKYAESSINPNSQDRFYSGELTVNVSEQGPNKIITPSVDSKIDLKAVILDSSASVTYQVVAFEESITRVTGQDVNGNPIQETVAITIPISTPETITLSVVSNVIYSNILPSKGSGKYILRLVPNRNNYSQVTLWSSTIVSPKDDYNGYGDLLSANFEPSIYKYEFDARPSWWKVSEGNRYLFDSPVSKTNDPLDGFVDNTFKPSLQSNATGVGKYGNGSGTYTSRPNLILGEAKYSSDTGSSNYIGMRLVPNLLGEGGLVKFTGIPVNNALFNSVESLGANDLGGSPNHQTIAAANVTAKIAQMYWEGVTTNRFYVNSNLATVTVSDNPVTYGFPAFASESDWAKPIIVNAVANADNLAFTTNVQGFVAPLVMSVERMKYNTSTDTFVNNQLPLGANEVWLLAFGTPFVPAQTALNGKFVRYFLESDIAFQFANVDTGESISFSDTLKITYSNGTFVTGLSEVPKVPSERVTPFGYDQPSNYTSGICYPPYVISDILLKDIAVSDSTLYNPSTPVGNYDVIWGDHTLSDLGARKLNVAEKIEFSYSITDNPTNIVTTSSKSLNDSDYTHRIKVEFPIFKADGTPFNEDVYEHIGNQEKVKDTYYLFVNARQNPTVSNSPLLSGIG